MESPSSASRVLAMAKSDREARAAGVTIEARYTVGEYDILILSADQSTGLATWLDDEGVLNIAGELRNTSPEAWAHQMWYLFNKVAPQTGKFISPQRHGGR